MDCALTTRCEGARSKRHELGIKTARLSEFEEIEALDFKK